MSRIKRPFSKGIAASSALAVCLIVSCVSMQFAFNAGNKNRTLLFAICNVVLCIATCLSIFLVVLERAGRTKMRTAEIKAFAPESALENYKAEHSFKDRIVFSLLTMGSGLLCVFFLSRTGHSGIKIVALGMCLFCLSTTYRYFFTTVMFGEESILVKLKPFTSYSESYKSVTAVERRPESMRIQFADGRVLTLPASMADPERITAILDRRNRNLHEA